MTRRYTSRATRSQRDGARGIEPLIDTTPDARDRPQPYFRPYTREVPSDHVAWAASRYLYPYVPSPPISAVYPFAAVRNTFCLQNGWAVGTL